MRGRLSANASASLINRKNEYANMEPAENISKSTRQAVDNFKGILVAFVIAVATGWISEDIIAPTKNGRDV